MARDCPGCLPSRGTLRRIRWRGRFYATAPVPRPPLRLSGEGATGEWRSHATLGLRRSSAATLRGGEGSTYRHRFEGRAHRRATADARAALGPRSLPPRSLFEGAARGLIRDQMPPQTTSATATDVRALRPRALEPRRDGGRNLLPFLTHVALSFESRVRVEPRFVHTSEVSVLVPPVTRFAQPRTLAGCATFDGFHRRSK